MKRRMLRLVLVFGWVVFLVNGQSGDLRTELSEQGTRGLAIGEFLSDQLTVFPLSGQRRTIRHFEGNYLLARFSPDGRAVVVNQMPEQVMIIDLTGQLRWQLQARFINVGVAALSNDGRRVALHGTFKPGGSRSRSEWKTGFFWGQKDSVDVTEILATKEPLDVDQQGLSTTVL